MIKKLGDTANITKLAGFEHTEYIQGNCSHIKENSDYIPLFIGKTVRHGQIDLNFDWYIPSKISEELVRSQLRKKCIVLPYVGSVGDLAIYDGTFNAHLGSNIAKVELTHKSQYLLEFLYYYLKSPIGQKILLKEIQGGIQKNITMEAIRNVELPTISIEEQNKIINILSRLDEQIKRNNDMVHKLQVLGKTIYSKNVNNCNYYKLKDISTIVTGKEDANHSTLNGKYKFFTCGDNSLLCDDYKFDGKSVLVAGNGNFNVKFYSGKFNAYQRTYIIQNDDIIGNLYYTLFFNTELFRKKSNGSIIKFITIDMLNKIEVPVLSLKTNEILNSILIKLNKIEESTTYLINLKNKLLPLLINQQLR